MQQLFKEEDLRGRRIDKIIHDSGNMVLFFTDKTFVVLMSDDLQPVYIDNEVIDLTPDYFNRHRLYNMGLISEEVVIAIEKERVKQLEDENRKKEIALLKQLQAKYPEA